MFSIIMPMDLDRLDQFANTKQTYDRMKFKKEFIIPTRNKEELKNILAMDGLMKDVRLIPYTIDSGYNCSKALNIGVSKAKYDQVIITSPEVVPKTEVLEQLSKCLGENIVCQVWDENENNDITISLVCTGFRDSNPGMYFLAMFNKKDILSINGWDENFMKGYAFEDDDFGRRWVRAGLPFKVRDDIQGIHQYHERAETIDGGAQINEQTLRDNDNAGVVWVKNGIIKE